MCSWCLPAAAIKEIRNGTTFINLTPLLLPVLHSQPLSITYHDIVLCLHSYSLLSSQGHVLTLALVAIHMHPLPTFWHKYYRKKKKKKGKKFFFLKKKKKKITIISPPLYTYTGYVTILCGSISAWQPHSCLISHIVYSL